MNIENFEPKNEMGVEELQEFINNPELDLPEQRRDLSKQENIRWLGINLMIRNEEKVSDEHWKVLEKLAKQ